MNAPRSGVCRQCLTAFQLPLMTCHCGKCEPSTPPPAPDMKPAVPQVTEEGVETSGEADAVFFAAMVQHAVASGLPATTEPGKVYLQIIAQKEGAAFLLTLEHSDGTKLGAFIPAAGMPEVVMAFDQVGSQCLLLDAQIRGPKG